MAMSDKHPRVGIGVIILKDGKFLIQRRKGSHGLGTWSIPGGHLEFGESFAETAEREVLEETGVKIKNVRFGAITNDILTQDDKHYVSIWLISEYESGTARIMEPDKCDGMLWCTLTTLPNPLAPWWKQLFESEFLDKIKKEIETSAI
jgi:8-oxo-dGTP diphosphatase